MKKIMMIAATTMIVLAAGAQDRSYWVVETSKASENKSLVRIYDASNQLVRETTVGRTIDISKRRERKKLDQLVVSTRRQQVSVASARKRNNKLNDERPVILE